MARTARAGSSRLEIPTGASTTSTAPVAFPVDACANLGLRSEQHAARPGACGARCARRHLRHSAVGAERVYCDCGDCSSSPAAGADGATTWRFA